MLFAAVVGVIMSRTVGVCGLLALELCNVLLEMLLIHAVESNDRLLDVSHPVVGSA